jgi:hypothetical protein
MADIGPTLREARMRAGLDISQIEAATKIRAKYLRALENEEWALLPGSAFTRGFLRSYAEMVGLDWRLLVEEYKRQWEEPNELDVAPVRPTIGFGAMDGEGGVRRWRLQPRLLIVAVALCIVVIAVVLLIRGPGSPSRAGNASSAKLPAGASTPASGAPTSPTGASALSCASTPGGVLPSGCVALRIEPTAAVSVCLIGDAGVVRLRDVKLSPFAARSPTFHARRFILTLSNSTAHLVIDSRVLALAPVTGAVRYQITAGRTVKLATPSHLRCT